MFANKRKYTCFGLLQMPLMGISTVTHKRKLNALEINGKKTKEWIGVKGTDMEGYI